MLYMAGIFVASSLSNPPMPSDVPDVSLHEAAYFGLTLLLIRALAHGRWVGVTTWTLIVAWLAAVGYGATDEWHQMYVSGRTAEWRDLAADSLGALAAGFVIRAWLFLRPAVSR
jgi:VanZ family protein